MTIHDKCRTILAARPDLRIKERHFELWLEYDVRHQGLPREAAEAILELRSRSHMANYESVRRASRKLINGEGWRP